MRAALFALLMPTILVTAREDLRGQAVGRSREDRGPLAVGQQISDTLPSGVAHQWTVDARAGEFVSVEVWQERVNLVLRVMEPEGALFVERDQSGQGFEAVAWIASRPGRWTVAVSARQPGDSGRYEIGLAGRRPAAGADRLIVLADSVNTDANRAIEDVTPENLARALELSRSASQLLQQAGAQKRGAFTLHITAHILQTLGHLDSAVVVYRRALEIRQQIGDHRGEGDTRQLLGTILRVFGQYDSARTELFAALTISRRARHPALEASTLHAINALYWELGRLDSALIYSRKALAVAQHMRDRSGEGYVLNGIASIHFSLGSKDSSLANYRRALHLHRQVGSRPGEAAALIGIGAWYVNSHPDSAISYLKTALAVVQEIGDRRQEGWTLANLGSAFGILGQPDSTLTYYQQALRVFTETGDQRGATSMMGVIARTHVHMGNLDSARTYLALTQRMSRETGNREAESRALLEAGYVFMRLGAADSARAYAQMGLDVARDAGSRLETLGHTLLGMLHQEAAPEQARASFGRALAQSRVIGDRATEAAVLERIANVHHLHVAPSDLSAALAYYDSAAAVGATLSASAGSDVNQISFRESTTSLYDAWTLAWLARSNEHDRASVRGNALAALAASERGRARALLDLMRDSSLAAEPGGDMASEGAQLLKAVAGRGTVVLVYVVTPDTVVAWLSLESGRPDVHRHAIPRDSLTALIHRFRIGLGVGDAALNAQLSLRDGFAPEPGGAAAARGVGLAHARVAGRTLVSVLVPSRFQQALAGADEILIVPQGPLALLPFGALPVYEWSERHGGDFGVRHALRYTPSLELAGKVQSQAPSLSPRARTSALEHALVVGDPLMPTVPSGNGTAAVLKSLPRARAEARWVAERLGAELLTDSAAGEQRVRDRLPNAQLIHLATHGYAYATDSKARDSFLALSPGDGHDGLFTVGDLLDDAKLELSADLVVLSACQTGFGVPKQAEGVLGLQRAFLAKGARSVLVSLWSVSDVATELLMKRFYSHWLGLEAGLSKAEALRRAQADVRGTPGWEHPRFWAAFQLVGAR